MKDDVRARFESIMRQIFSEGEIPDVDLTDTDLYRAQRLLADELTTLYCAIIKFTAEIRNLSFAFFLWPITKGLLEIGKSIDSLMDPQFRVGGHDPVQKSVPVSTGSESLRRLLFQLVLEHRQQEGEDAIEL